MGKNDDFELLKERAKQFAVRIIKLADSLPQRRSCDIIGRQIIRSATSIGANYRAACRARSKAEFVSKLHTVQEESDETQYWLEVLQLSGAIADSDFREVYQEASELTAIFTASEKTARHHEDRDQR
ncbi:MAG: four helix bundle protein [Bacteroidota bacterium]